MTSFDDYAAIPALNWSTLKLLAVSPKLLKFRETTPRQDTDALALGRAIHCAVLEPDDFGERFAVAPTFEGKGSRAMRATWLAERNPSVTFLDAADHTTAERCAESIREHAEAMRLLRGGRREETIRWTDQATGLACKMRADNIRPNDLSDIKSTRKETPAGFLRDASAFLYHGQLAFYHDGAVAAGMLPETAELPGVVAVQTTEPYDVFAFRMTRQAYWAGQSLYRSLIKRYAECQAAQFWPGAAPGLLEFNVTPWAATGGDEEEENDRY